MNFIYFCTYVVSDKIMNMLNFNFRFLNLATFVLFIFSPLLLLYAQPDTINNEVDSLRNKFADSIDQAKGDSLKLMHAYYRYAEYLDNEGDFETCKPMMESALRLAVNIQNHKEIATIANHLARVYLVFGEHVLSNQAYETGLVSAEKIEDHDNIIKISMNLANNYNLGGDYNKAITYALKALEAREKYNNLERICYDYVSMGNIFKENDNMQKWEEYILKAYKMKDIEGCASIGDIAKIYNGLGGIAESNSQFEKALLYYDTLMVLSKQGNYFSGINTSFTNSALVYKRLNKPEKALELIIEAEKYFGSHPYEFIFNNNIKAELYHMLGQNEKALNLVLENINKDEIQFYISEKIKCLRLLYEVNYSLANYSEAHRWNDSLSVTEGKYRDQNVREMLEELETRYETTQKQQQIELLITENQLKNQRFKMAIGGMFVLLIVIVFIVVIWRYRKKQLILIQTDLRQQVLRAQMNPHFIFNVLGSIQNFMKQNDTPKASNYLAQFASLVRATLKNSVAETISLADEIGMLKSYMALEQMRLGNSFDYQVIYDDDLEVDLIDIPPMLIQPFVENSIKHGLKGKDEKGLLTLTIRDKRDWVEFVVEDNGGGMKVNNAPQEHQSMAMGIFEKRRKLIQQKYGKEFKYELVNLKDTDPSKTGVRITVHIPILEV